MELNENIGIFWSASAARWAQTRDAYGALVGGAHPTLVCATPASPIPVPTIWGLAPEHPRMEALFTMPYIFLPDAAWMRRPGEDAPSYHTRVILTLRLMDLLEEENGIWHEAQVTKGFDASAPDWYDEDGDWARGDRLRTAFAQRYSEFDQGDLFDASESVARLSVPASLALWQRDLALHDSAEGRAALEEFMGADTPSTSDELMAGFENGREIVGTLFASLAGLGLEPPDLPDLVNVL